MTRLRRDVSVAARDAADVDRPSLSVGKNDQVIDLNDEREPAEYASPDRDGSLLGLRVRRLERLAHRSLVVSDHGQVSDPVPPDRDKPASNQVRGRELV